MELKEIKRILEEEGGKIIFAGEDGPALVIMKLEDYRGRKESQAEAKLEPAPIIPREIEAESLKIDDLPF